MILSLHGLRCHDCCLSTECDLSPRLCRLRDKLPAGSVDLAFADPPFSIGYDYDVYDDGKDPETYLGWCKQWISGAHCALKDDGTFWLAIGNEDAAELKVIAQ